MKISKLIFSVCCFFVAAMLGLAFLLPANTNTAFAAESDFLNKTEVAISSSIGADFKTNNSLIKKGTAEFEDENLITPKRVQNKNQDIVLSIQGLQIDESKSFYAWVFVSSLVLPDLTVALSNETNSLSWTLSGSDLYSNVSSELQFGEIIEEYHDEIKGWKLVEFNLSDAFCGGEKTFEIKNITLSSGLALSETDPEICFANMFVADKTGAKTTLVNHQGYLAYATKSNIVQDDKVLYVGDSLTISSATEIFYYAIIGLQNMLKDTSGYTWNIYVTTPSGKTTPYTLASKVNITFEEEGSYLIEASLTDNDTKDYLPLISRVFNLSTETFRAGYFIKSTYDVFLGSKTQIVFNLSKDFVLDETKEITVVSSDKNIIDATYYLEGRTLFILADAESAGTSLLKVNLYGIKTGETESKLYEYEAKISVKEIKPDNTKLVIWISFGLLVAGAFVYLIILFVKSRRFGVK